MSMSEERRVIEIIIMIIIVIMIDGFSLLIQKTGAIFFVDKWLA